MCLKNLSRLFCSPTTEAVGSNFIIFPEPTALVVGVLTDITSKSVGFNYIGKLFFEGPKDNFI